MTAALAGELDRLEKAATPGEWEFVRKEIRETVANSVKVGDHVVAFTGFDKESPHSPADAALIVWLRNHTDEIKDALRRLRLAEGAAEAYKRASADYGLIDYRAVQERAESAEAERDAWKRTADERSSTQLAKRAIEAEAERDQLRATVQRAMAVESFETIAPDGIRQDVGVPGLSHPATSMVYSSAHDLRDQPDDQGPSRS